MAITVSLGCEAHRSQPTCVRAARRAKASEMASSRFKVVLLGEGRVGKTSILLRFVRGEYTDKQKSTLQASCVAPSRALSLSRARLPWVWVWRP